MIRDYDQIMTEWQIRQGSVRVSGRRGAVKADIFDKACALTRLIYYHIDTVRL